MTRSELAEELARLAARSELDKLVLKSDLEAFVAKIVLELPQAALLGLLPCSEQPSERFLHWVRMSGLISQVEERLAGRIQHAEDRVARRVSMADEMTRTRLAGIREACKELAWRLGRLERVVFACRRRSKADPAASGLMSRFLRSLQSADGRRAQPRLPR